MSNYEKQIEGMSKLREFMLSKKDEKISELENTLKDQEDDIKNIKKNLSFIRSDNKKNADKIFKQFQENVPIDQQTELEQLVQVNKELTQMKFRHIETETVFKENERLKRENEEMRRMIQSQNLNQTNISSDSNNVF